MDERRLITFFLILVITFTFGYLMGRKSVVQYAGVPVVAGQPRAAQPPQAPADVAQPGQEPETAKKPLFSFGSGGSGGGPEPARKVATRPGGVTVICDFEDKKDVDLWEGRAAKLELSREHASQGQYCLKARLLGNVGSSAILMEDYFERRSAPRDWSKFEILAFDVYNEEATNERVILQIKDVNGTRYKKDLFLDGKQTKQIKLYIEALADILKVSDIRQFNLFRWNPQADVVIYIDNIRLVPEGVEETAQGGVTDTPTAVSQDEGQLSLVQAIDKAEDTPRQDGAGLRTTLERAAETVPFTSRTGEDAALLTQEAQSVGMEGSAEAAQTPAQAPVSAPALAGALGAVVDEQTPVLKTAFEMHPEKWMVPGESTGEKYVRIPLKIVGTGKDYGSRWLASGGIPFPRGALGRTSQFRLIDTDGRAVPFQAWILARYQQDQSARWVQVDTKKGLKDDTENTLFLEYDTKGAEQKQEQKSPLKLREDGSHFFITTGPIQLAVSKEHFTVFDGAWVDLDKNAAFTENEIVSGAGDMTMQCRGRLYRTSLDTTSYQVAVEEEGPLKVTLKASGWFRDEEGNGFCQCIVRLSAFSGEDFIRLYHTFMYTGYPENDYYDRYRDLKLPENETIEEILVLIPYRLGTEMICNLGAEVGSFEGPFHETIGLLQDRCDRYVVEKASGEEIATEERAGGWVDLSDKEKGIAVAVRDFWQQYPKAFIVSDNPRNIAVKLWPKEAGDLDLKTTRDAYGPDAIARGNAFGLAKTHELLVSFHPGNVVTAGTERLVKEFNNQPALTADSRWMCDVEAFGRLHPFDTDYFYDEEVALIELFDWAERQPRNFKWYGMLDWGDVLSWYRKDAYDKSYDSWGWHPEGRWGWYNCDTAGPAYGALIQFARTGERRYLDFAEHNAKHIMDVDTCHYNTVANDPRLVHKLDDEVSQVGSMHRHNGNHWGGRNEVAAYTNPTALLYYYYLTGYERAFDVAKEVGEFFLTDPVTYTRHPDEAPARAIGNVLRGDILLYEATGEARFKQAADKWAGVLVKGQRSDGAWRETYDPAPREWRGDTHPLYTAQYIMPALIDYHRVTGEAGAARAIIKSTDFMIENNSEYPFFDSLAYSYWLTGDRHFLNDGRKILTEVLRNQMKDPDPLKRGLIFKKQIYHRPNHFLGNIPYIFRALFEGENR